MLTVEHLEFKIVDDRDGLVVAADVLANSLAYLFKTRPPEEQFKALNTPEAFQRHTLKDCLDSFWDLSGYNFTAASTNDQAYTLFFFSLICILRSRAKSRKGS